jgi:hypothetical protein
MMSRIAIVLAFAVTSAAINVQGASSLKFDVEDAKNRPVTKVVTLLKDMLVQLGKEAEEDQEIYDNMACWCTTNDKEKTKAIDDAEAHIEDLTTEIEELTALSSRLTTEIENLEKEIAKNQAALEKATAMREKELAEFNAEEKATLQSIDSLDGAIKALAKHHGGAALLQTKNQDLLPLATIMQREITKHAKLLEGVLTRTQKKTLAAFVQSSGKQPASAGSYAPASGEIFGILKQMKETFENDVAESQKEELANQKAYEELKAAKENEIAAAQEQVTTKTGELATTDEKNAQAKQDREDTTEALSADEKYLMNLKEKCQMTDQEFEERLKTRQLEMQAVSKAMAVLTSDDAMDTFSNTFGFLQITSKVNLKSSKRTDASNLLAAVARKYNNPRIMTLAYKVRLDAFTKVKKAIDDMIAELLKQKEDEIKQKDFCVEGFNENEKQTNEKTREKTDLITLIEDLTMKIDELHKAIETLKAEIAEMQVQMKRAGEDREKENKEFQTTVAEQRATQVLLTKALSVLQGFYGKEAALLQNKNKQPAGPPPPPGFKAYKKSNAAGGVMGMIQQIINDAKAMEAEAIKGEEDAQKAYETFVTDTNASINEKSKEIVNKSEEKAKAEGKRTEAEEQKAEVIQNLEDLSDENADLHKACDYVLKNFDIRQTGRDEEVEALKQAKAILSGSKFSEFLAIGFKN